MGKFFLTFSFLFVSIISLCQKKQWKNELSISALKVSTSSYYNYSFDLPLPFIGANIIYKHRIHDKFYIRVSQSYYRYSINDRGYFFYDNGSSERKVQEINTSSGVELRYFITKTGKFVLHSGFDASLFIHNARRAEHFRGNDIPYYDFNISNTVTGFGIQGFSGLSYYPAKRLVLSLEGSILIGFYKQKTRYFDLNSSTESTIKDDGIEPYAQLFLLRTASIGWRF